MYFQIVGEVSNIEVIAVGSGIRDTARLRKRYGTRRWRKLKGTAIIRLPGQRLTLLAAQVQREMRQ
jgi:hypothetical protein